MKTLCLIQKIPPFFSIKDTVDLFTVENVCDIQSEDSQVATDNVIEVEIDQPSNDMMSIEVKQEPDSCDDEETIENQDDALVSDATTTTTMMQNFNSEPTSVMMSGKNNGRNIDRLSMDLVDYAPITSIIPGMPHIDSEMFQSEIEIHEEKPNFTAVIKMEDEVSLPASVESDFVTEAASFESEDIKFAIGLNQPAKRFHDPVENSIESADKKRRIDQEVLLHASNKATNGKWTHCNNRYRSIDKCILAKCLTGTNLHFYPCQSDEILFLSPEHYQKIPFIFFTRKSFLEINKKIFFFQASHRVSVDEKSCLCAMIATKLQSPKIIKILNSTYSMKLKICKLIGWSIMRLKSCDSLPSV